MINEALKLMQSKQNNSPIVPMYTTNIPMDNQIFYYLKKNYMLLVCKNNNCRAQKPKLIPKIQCTFGTIISYVL